MEIFGRCFLLLVIDFVSFCSEVVGLCWINNKTKKHLFSNRANKRKQLRSLLIVCKLPWRVSDGNVCIHKVDIEAWPKVCLLDRLSGDIAGLQRKISELAADFVQLLTVARIEFSHWGTRSTTFIPNRLAPQTNKQAYKQTNKQQQTSNTTKTGHFNCRYYLRKASRQFPSMEQVLLAHVDRLQRKLCHCYLWKRCREILSKTNQKRRLAETRESVFQIWAHSV